jgi:acid stress-induced BolA-like protein IbaG/YrbA
MSDPMIQALHDSIVEAMPGAQVVVSSGSPGHYSLEVTSAAFEGKSLLEKQRQVYSAIAHLMKGDAAPVHAIDSMKTLTP